MLCECGSNALKTVNELSFGMNEDVIIDFQYYRFKYISSAANTRFKFDVINFLRDLSSFQRNTFLSHAFCKIAFKIFNKAFDGCFLF